jgi:type II secretory pathway pseudopilin PulG
MSAPAVGRWLLVVAGVVIVATVAAAIVVTGTPGVQRQLRMDDRRVDDLQQIQVAARAYRERTGALPESLEALAAQPGVGLSMADPATSRPYAYRRLAGDRFSLCAVFATDTGRPREGARRWIDLQWAHGSGRQCFEFDGDPGKDRPAAAVATP